MHSRPSKQIDQSVVGSKWVFKNKVNDLGVVVRNKARLVAKGYNQIIEVNQSCLEKV